MEVISANCPACGGIYGGKLTSRFITCEFCGTRFALSENELRAMGFVDSDGDGYDDNDYDEYDEEYEDLDPIDEYAAEACSDFLDEYPYSHSSFTSSRKVERGLDISSEETVFLIHDDTMFKSGKNGFAITSHGFSCRELGEKRAHYVSWEDFAKGPMPRLDDSYIRQGETSLVYFTDDSDVLEDGLIRLLEDLYNHAQAVL